MKPLENVFVIEMCQYLAGPSAGLRLADLGARVIKIEPPGAGEGGRTISIKNLFAGKNSILFHTINRNKESYAANLKDREDLEKVKKLISRADILIHNFRPGKIKKIGLDYPSVQEMNPGIIYGAISGYGKCGPWASKPGQDLLVQALSGLAWLSGDHNDPPVPFGVSVVDILCGAQLAQGLLAALIKRGKTRQGSLVEVSLLESALDLQFELLTTYLNDGGKNPRRARKGNAHAYLSAPYGIYQTRDGFIAVAMEDVHQLGIIMDCPSLLDYKQVEWFTKRDEVMHELRNFYQTKTTDEWLSLLEPHDIWCADVYDYSKFLNSEGYRILQMQQDLKLEHGKTLTTTRCPIRIDGKRIFNSKHAPAVGEHTIALEQEFDL